MMNERIRELAEQAGFETDRGPLIGPSPYIKVGGLCVGVPLEKFAELIIQQCFSICEDLGDQGLDGHYCADEIKRTFGVKA